MRKPLMSLGYLIRYNHIYPGAFGNELEYADAVTLTRAIEGRQEF